eukprot:878859-Karenia_brevis.AAC.1
MDMAAVVEKTEVAATADLVEVEVMEAAATADTMGMVSMTEVPKAVEMAGMAKMSALQTYHRRPESSPQ